LAARFASLPVLTPRLGLLYESARFAPPSSDTAMAVMDMTFFIVLSFCCGLLAAGKALSQSSHYATDADIRGWSNAPLIEVHEPKFEFIDN
jgi:hypothetical protein